MAKEETGNSEASAGDAPKAGLASKLPAGVILFTIANMIVGLGATGMLVYTRLLFKRPPITETTERARLEKAAATTRSRPEKLGLIPFDSITVNIKSTTERINPTNPNDSRTEEKQHYITLTFSLELRNIDQKDQIDAIKPVFMDRLLSLIGKKDFSDLNTVQGRYVLRSQIMDLANQLASEPLVSNVYVSHFVVQ